MSASRGSSRAPRQLGHDPALPEHLVVWPGGDPREDDTNVVEDDRLTSAFRMGDWIRTTHVAHPAAVLAASFTSLGPEIHPSLTWLDLATCAAGVDVDGQRRAFTGDTTPTSLRSLRQWTASQVDPLPYSVDDVVLVVSELATNVERHADGWLTVDLVQRGDMLVVAVTDPVTTAMPTPRRVGPEVESGRGLLVVATLAACWGLVVRPSSKSVWAAFCP